MIVTGHEFIGVVRNVIERVNAIIDKQGRTAFVIDENVVISDAMLTRMFQALQCEGAENVISQMFVDSCAKLGCYGDAMAGGHARYLAQACLSAITLGATGVASQHIIDQLVKEKTLALAELDRLAGRASMKEMLDIVRLGCPDQRIAEMVVSALDLAGVTSKIVIEKSHGHCCVEKTIGHNFSFVPVMPSLVLTTWQQKNVRCVVIDGMIESVSEIHSLLQRAHETSQSIAFFCRGYDQDVINTFVTNRLRRTLNVHAVMVPYDIRHANSLNDVAIVCGCDVMSSLKGDVISTKRFESFPAVDKVAINHGNVMISNASTHKNVTSHARYLMSQRNDSVLEDVTDSYDARIRSLGGSNVTIRVVGDSESDTQRLFELADSTLRTAQAIMKFGVIDTKRISYNGSMISNTVLTDCIKNVIPSPQTMAASHVAVAAFIQSVCCSAGIITR